MGPPKPDSNYQGPYSSNLMQSDCGILGVHFKHSYKNAQRLSLGSRILDFSGYPRGSRRKNPESQEILHPRVSSSLDL